MRLQIALDTIKQIVRTLGLIFSDTHRQDIVDANPVAAWKLMRPRLNRKKKSKRLRCEKALRYARLGRQLDRLALVLV